jgi:3-oxoacyl-[acyl-carrier-protein] synthase II
VNVALTGWSVLSPLATTREAFAEAVCTGRSGIAPIESFDTAHLDSHLGAMLQEEIDYKHYIPAARLRRMDTLTRQMAYVACEAFQHAGLTDWGIAPERRAVVVASGMNHTESIEKFFASLLEEGPEGANPILFPSTIPNGASGLIAIELGCRGPNLTVTQKETSAEQAFAVAAGLLENGEADVVLLVAGESLTRVVFEGLAGLRALSRGGEGAEGLWPYSRRRNGFVAGEGSAAVVLERPDDVRASGRPILGRLLGAAECCQACSPVKYPTDPLPLANAIDRLARQTGRDPAAIAFLNGAANSTRSLDAAEAETIRTSARNLGRSPKDLPVAALKASLGESFAGGLTRIVAALAALEAGVCPPVPFEAAVHESEFPDIRLSYPDAPIAISGTDVLHLSTAAGGHQMALWLTREAE